MSEDYDDRCDDEMREARELKYWHECRMKDLRDGIPPWNWSNPKEEDDE